jgi:hypothetical protein
MRIWRIDWFSGKAAIVTLNSITDCFCSADSVCFLWRQLICNCCVDDVQKLRTCFVSVRYNAWKVKLNGQMMLCLSRPFMKPDSMQHSPSWGADSCSPTQEIPRFLLNPNVHCCDRQGPSLIPNEFNPVSTPTPLHLYSLILSSHQLLVYFFQVVRSRLV